MKISVVTLFPELFPGLLGHSITGRALAAGLWSCTAINIRDFAHDKHRTVDDTPYGGGAGMVMRPDIVAAAVDHATAQNPDVPVIFLAPTGTPLTQPLVDELATHAGMVVLCGHYEGIDQRVIDSRTTHTISIGDYVLTGGEVAAMVLIDAVVRQRRGVLGNADTLHEESFSDGLLEYPHYTRPEVWEGQAVPDVLKSGHHGNIAKWRFAQSCARTQAVRPDLWQAWQAKQPKQDAKDAKRGVNKKNKPSQT